MTNLTEKWKKGELPAGYYYVKNEFNNIFPSDYSESYDSINDAVIKDFFTEVSEIKEVLEQVPSYEQWQKHRKTLLKTQEKNCDLEIINTKLKSLLKECRYIMETEKNFPSCHFEKDTFVKLLAKINQVLGEE